MIVLTTVAHAASLSVCVLFFHRQSVVVIAGGMGDKETTRSKKNSGNGRKNTAEDNYDAVA